MPISISRPARDPHLCGPPYLSSWITSKAAAISLHVNTRSTSKESLTAHHILCHPENIERETSDVG